MHDDYPFSITRVERIRDALTPYLHRQFDALNLPILHVGLDYQSHNDIAHVYHARVTFDKLDYKEASNLASMMSDITSFEEDGFDVNGLSFIIGDGDDGCAAWLTGGVLYFWVRHFP